MKEIKRLTRCEKGHFYDAGKYDYCPHCRNTRELSVTEYGTQTGRADDGDSLTMPLHPTGEPLRSESGTPVSEFSMPKRETAAASSFPSMPRQDDPSTMTVHFYQKALGSEPVVGWLVCVEGVHFGQDFRIKSGRNFIGRSGNMDVCLSGDMAVSRDRHAILTYDPKGNTFFAQPGDTLSALSYLNDKPLLEATAIKCGDMLTVGETNLRFVPFCDGEFTWEKKEDRT